MPPTAAAEAAAAAASDPLLPSNSNPTRATATSHRQLHLVIHSALLLLGSIFSHLLLTLFHLHRGGPSLLLPWFHSTLNTSAFPILLLFLLPATPILRSQSAPLLLPPPLLASSLSLGLVFSLPSYSPIFTTARLLFTALFTSLLSRRTPNPYSLNALLVLTFAAILPALSRGQGHPFLSSLPIFLGCSAAHGATLCCVERAYHRYAKPPRWPTCIAWVLQFQIGFAGASTLAALLGMAVNREFEAILGEAAKFDLGKTTCYVVMVGIALSGLMVVVGLLGVAYSSSALFAAALATAASPFGEATVAIIFGGLSPGGQLAIAAAMSLWGLVSYLCGDYQKDSVESYAATDDDS